MFNNLRFATKIGLLPTLAGCSFLVILAILLVTGRQGANLLVDIERGYYASLELNRQLHADLSGIQSSFQDAASMADMEYLEDTDELRDKLVAAMEHGQFNTVVDTSPLKKLQDDFEAYFAIARPATASLIDGSGDLEIYTKLQQMSQLHTTMLNDIELLTTRDKQDVTNAIATAQQRQQYATLFLAFVSVASILLLVVSSIVIIRTASQSVQTTVDGINALAAGNFSHQFAAVSGDEMGQMVDRVQHVTRTVDSVAGEIDGLIDAVRAGQLDARGNPENFEGSYANLIENINELIEAFVAPIEATSNCIDRISHGDMPAPLETEYQGDFNKTKKNLNVLISTMNGLISQVAGMTSAAKAGDLDQRGNADEFAGVWAELVDGINDTLDAVTEPLQDFSGAMSAMAHGDLRFKSDNTYEGEFAELQHDINSTVGKLTDVIGSIKASGDSAAVVANELSEGNLSLRQRTDAQAKSLQETARSMADMTTTVKKNAESAQRAKERVSEASERAKKGGSVVNKAVAAMDAINASSARIADIINVIDEIAFQTNLLALNAAVEAARAGDEGKGFAVVASEVRNLAGRSATAAKEINDLIQDSVGKIEEGSRLVHDSGETLKEIVSAVVDVDEIVGEISDSSQTQATNIDNVSDAMAAMDAMTKENAELADAAVRSSNLMGEEAQRLNQMTAFFQTEGDPGARQDIGAEEGVNEDFDGSAESGAVKAAYPAA